MAEFPLLDFSGSLPEEELKLEWDEDGHNGTKVEISNEFSMLEYRLIDVKTSSDVAEMEYGTAISFQFLGRLVLL